MFTGIITAKSRILQSNLTENGLSLTIEVPKTWSKLKIGESINTNGVCLTISSVGEKSYKVLLIPETLSRSVFGKKIPDVVNLERALSAGDRFGGHFVQGHIDCTGIINRIDMSKGYLLEVTYPREFSKLVIPKGSITIDGVALTVVTTQDNTFTVALVPHTLEQTTLKNLNHTDTVNIEFDMLGKYVVNIMGQGKYAKS